LQLGEIERWQVVLLAEHHRSDRSGGPVRPVLVWVGSSSVSMLVRMLVLVQEVVVLVVGMESL
jgi:hypothetical protein